MNWHCDLRKHLLSVFHVGGAQGGVGESVVPDTLRFQVLFSWYSFVNFIVRMVWTCWSSKMMRIEFESVFNFTWTLENLKLQL